jgi:glycosyltransferase involved in cell wall biosynthesis
METRPKVLICVLCGPERNGWINPRLTDTLLRTVRDQRFAVEIEFIYGAHGVDRARNLAIDKAREKQADWCIQIDNDMTIADPLGILSDANAKALDIISVGAGISKIEGTYQANVDLTRENCGNFMRITNAGAGVLMIRSSVWQKIPKATLFVWTADCGEDVYFANFVQTLGFKLWTHATLAGHLKTVDITSLLRGVRQ